jgi:hypothetical protein
MIVSKQYSNPGHTHRAGPESSDLPDNSCLDNVALGTVTIDSIHATMGVAPEDKAQPKGAGSVSV